MGARGEGPARPFSRHGPWGLLWGLGPESRDAGLAGWLGAGQVSHPRLGTQLRHYAWDGRHLDHLFVISGVWVRDEAHVCLIIIIVVEEGGEKNRQKLLTSGEAAVQFT